jgi:hypothetical protein
VVVAVAATMDVSARTIVAGVTIHLRAAGRSPRAVGTGRRHVAEMRRRGAEQRMARASWPLLPSADKGQNSDMGTNATFTDAHVMTHTLAQFSSRRARCPLTMSSSPEYIHPTAVGLLALPRRRVVPFL